MFNIQDVDGCDGHLLRASFSFLFFFCMKNTWDCPNVKLLQSEDSLKLSLFLMYKGVLKYQAVANLRMLISDVCRNVNTV